MKTEMQTELLEKLLEAESIIGSPVTHMFLDDVNPEYRLTWLREVRNLLTRNKVEPENLKGRWRT